MRFGRLEGGAERVRFLGHPRFQRFRIAAKEAPGREQGCARLRGKGRRSFHRVRQKLVPRQDRVDKAEAKRLFEDLAKMREMKEDGEPREAARTANQ